MSVPVTGAIILIVAVYLFLFAPRYLYPALIISIPFSATAIVNFPLTGAAYGIGKSPEKSVIAFQLFFILWIVHEAFSRFPQWHRRGWLLTRRARSWLLAFLGAVALSLSVPLVLGGTSWATSLKTISWNYYVVQVPMRLTFYHLTQSVYLVFGVLVTIFVAAENWHYAKLFSTIKIYVSSCTFVAAWGLFQFWCYVTSHSYPAAIFNTGKNVSDTGYLQKITANGLIWGRISSVTKEPSALARNIVAALILILISSAFQRPLFQRGWNQFAIAIMITVLVVSTSTTAYFGIFAVLILVGIALARVRNRQWKAYAVIALACLAIGAIVVSQVPILTSLASTQILGKYSGMNTGATRLDSVKIAAQEFLNYPIFGTGWLTVESSDLVLLILTNTGMVGLLAFGAFLVPVFLSLWRSTLHGGLSATLVWPLLAWGLIFAEGVGLTYGGSLFWLILGLATGATAAAKTERWAGTALHNAVLTETRRL